MKRIAFLLILCNSWMLQSCILDRDESRVNVHCKQGCVTFNIDVKTGHNSQTSVADAYVELGWDSGYPINPGRLIAKGYTKKNGNLTFSFTPDAKELREGKFYVKARKDKTYYRQYNTYYGIDAVDTTVNASVHLPSKAIVKVVYKNFYPTSSADYFSGIPHFSTYGSGLMAVEKIKNKNEEYAHNYWFRGSESPFQKFEITGETAGNQYTYFYILIKKDGLRIDRSDSIYIKNGETGIYEIDF